MEASLKEWPKNHVRGCILEELLVENVVLTELICAVDFLTSRQFMASVFGIPLVERKNGFL